MWFMNVDIGVYGGMIVVMVWFMGQFLFMNMECCIWCSIFDICQFWDFCYNSVNYMVELCLVYFMVQQGVVQ